MKLHLIAPLILSLASSILAADPTSPTQSKPEKTIKVACVGDSITQGAGAGKGKAYPTQLQALLGSGWEVGNFGVSGRTLLRKGDHPYWIEKAFQKAQDFQPNVVIIMLGTNDTKPQNWSHKEEFENDYRDLIKTFQALKPTPSIYICRPVPVPAPGNYGINETALQEQMPTLKKLAEELKVGVIDMYGALEGKPKLLPDRVHPNAEGAGEMAKAAAAVLTLK